MLGTTSPELAPETVEHIATDTTETCQPDEPKPAWRIELKLEAQEEHVAHPVYKPTQDRS